MTAICLAFLAGILAGHLDRWLLAVRRKRFYARELGWRMSREERVQALNV